jgi:alpha-tubulin suppressor-like RCC1 family protein
VLIGGAALVAGLFGASWLLFGIPNQRLGDVQFLEHATEEEAARTAERVLWFPIGNHHDACLMIDAVGDVRSVPALLQALRYNPPDEGGMVCTTMHCFDALRAVTGYDGGNSREEWVTWWETTGARLPASAFPLGMPSAPEPAPPAPLRVPRPAPKADATACAYLDHGLGSSHTCVRKRDGTAWCWGDNASAGPSLRPQQVAALGDGVAELASAHRRTCARKIDGTLWCWSIPSEPGASAPPFHAAPFGDQVSCVALGGSKNCVIKTDGTLWCWMHRPDGEVLLGPRSHARRRDPWTAQIKALGATLREVAHGSQHACARRDDGSVWCWGSNSSGQLGRGTRTEDPKPSVVSMLDQGVVELASGDEHTCARKEDGTVWCWGRNQAGEVGDGTRATALAPEEVTTLGVGAVQIVAGGIHTCARKDDGTVWCWGRNQEGQLGDGTMTDSVVPVEVTALGSSVVEIAAGGDHTCARTVDGALFCWGWNKDGQLGDGTTTQRALPARVIFDCGAP